MRPGPKLKDFLSMYEVDEDGCWLWTGAPGSAGYGQARGTSAHRFFYVNLVGPVPKGMHLDHVCHVPGECMERLCKHRRCVNPEHLKIATPKENALRSNSFAARNAALTHCPHGHPYSGDNLINYPKQRGCRTCVKRNSRNAKAREKERIPTLETLTASEKNILETIGDRRLADRDILALVDLSPATVRFTRASLHRGGLIESAGIVTRPEGTYPAMSWRRTR